VYEVRRLRANEAKPAATLWNELVGGQLAPHQVDKIERHLEADADHPEAVAFVVESDGRLLGIATAHVASHPTMEGLAGEIDELMIDERLPDEAGEALAREAIAWLRAHGAGPVFHYRAAELPSAFWERLGFEGDVVRFSLYE
jgi:GNAT superfamily N-acetyltransferase